jgi:isopenicillin N synthase-like dioxygenase
MMLQRAAGRRIESIPLIDIAGLRAGGAAVVTRIADQLGDAARTIGFFRITGHGIDQNLIAATYAMAARYFAQADDVKMRNYIGHSCNHRGYVPFTEKGDYADEVHRNYESFDLGIDLPVTDPDFLAGQLIVGPNVWPDLPGFRETVGRYVDQVAGLGQVICTALERHLRLPPGAMTSQMRKPLSQLRLLHYVRDGGNATRQTVNMGAHTDYECLTLLHTRNPGLQVMTQDDQWIDVPVDPTAYVVNIGDMLEAWTNGLFRSTPHRVLNLSPERFSLPYFVAANADAVIRPFAQLVTPDQPAAYEPFRAGAHLERMLQRDFPYLRARLRGRDGGPAATIRNPFEDRITAAGPQS